MRRSMFFALVFGAVGTGCAPAGAQNLGLFGPSCPLGSSPMLRTELIFGTERKALPPVKQAEWRRFVDREIAQRFPDGFTILDGEGGWRGSHGVVREKSHMLIVWHATPGADEKFEALRTVYKQQFHQEAVLRADGSDCVGF